MTRTRPARRPANEPSSRLALAPGVHVLRRSATELQVGLGPERAVVLDDLPAVRDLLGWLGSPAAAPPQAYDAEALALLWGAGLVVDADALLPLLPATATAAGAARRADVAAVAALAGDRAEALLGSRAAAGVAMVTSGGGLADAVAAQVAGLLTAAGAHTFDLALGEPPPQGTGVGLLACVGEPHREHADPWLREGVPHLFLRLVEGQVRVGPFVVPGVSACLRCVDAHHTDVDPAWPLLVAQYAAATARERDDTIPEPVDPLLACLAAAWAARELVSHLEGSTPATTSTTIDLDPRLTALHTQTWTRHPACGCAWG